MQGNMRFKKDGSRAQGSCSACLLLAQAELHKVGCTLGLVGVLRS